MGKVITKFKKILQGGYLPKKLGINTEEHDYDWHNWHNLPLYLKVVDLIFYSFIPGYNGEATKRVLEENAPHIRGD